MGDIRPLRYALAERQSLSKTHNVGIDPVNLALYTCFLFLLGDTAQRRKVYFYSSTATLYRLVQRTASAFVTVVCSLDPPCTSCGRGSPCKTGKRGVLESALRQCDPCSRAHLVHDPPEDSPSLRAAAHRPVRCTGGGSQKKSRGWPIDARSSGSWRMLHVLTRLLTSPRCCCTVAAVADAACRPQTPRAMQRAPASLESG